jgi:hypothetical protein
LIDNEGLELRFSGHEAFATEALCQIERLNSVDSVYAFWSRNSQSFAQLRQRTSGDSSELARRIADALEERARQVGHALLSEPNATTDAGASGHDQQSGESCLIPKEKRIRDRAHLAFVANEPCLICGRRPTRAHHLRFAQPRAMSLKVSDEFNVPLCNIHHDQLHRAGDERAF